ncbi:MAG: hypothetical protein IT210_15760 [Armatimonadetes bacterium]|nr:hypothetical protein [Armatimonadota bacterium]
MRFFPAMRAAVGLLLAALALPLFANPTDILPRGDWPYDDMASLSARGLLTGVPVRYFHGDRLFTRLEMAQILTRALESAASRDDTALAFDPSFKRLSKLLAPELESLSAPLPEPTLPIPPEKPPLTLTGYGQLRYVSDKSADGFDGIFRATALADLGPHWLAGVTLTNERRELLTAQDVFFPAQVLPDQQTLPLPDRGFLKDRFPLLDKAFVRGQAGPLTVNFGRFPIRWGPSYTGGMLLSGNAPNLTALSLRLPMSLGFLGRWNLEQFYTTFTQEGNRVYLVGRRLEHRFSGGWSFGYSETLKSSRQPNLLTASFAPLVVYQDISGDREVDFNNLVNIDLTYRNRHGNEYYGELLIDDIRNPFDFLLHNKKSVTPQKAGWLLGAYLPEAGTKNTSLRLEYIQTDKGTYLQKNPRVAHTFEQMFLGHPIGTNAKGLFVRIEHRFTGKLWGAAQALIRNERQTGLPVGDGDIGLIGLSYDLAPSRTIGFKWLPYRITDGRGGSVRGDRIQFEGSYHF